MNTNIRGVILGAETNFKALNKKIGDAFKVYCFNFKDIDFEVEIIETSSRPV